MEKKKFSFLFYKEKDVPQFYEVHKGFFKFFLYGLPIITLSCLILITGLLVYFKQIREVAKRKEPAVIRELKLKNLELEKGIKVATNARLSLEKKLVSSASSSGLKTMSIFKIPPGQKDLTKSPKLTVKNVESSEVGKTYNLSFNLNNNSQEKVAGYIFIIMRQGNSYQFYPEGMFEENEIQIDFNKGQYFATSRFRPVLAKFLLPAKKVNALFKILVFSRDGDLVLKHTFSRTIGQK